MRYIQSFQNDSAIQAAVDDKSLGKPYIALNEQTGEIDWDTKMVGQGMYLTIKALEDGNFLIGATRTIEYSVSNNSWVSTSTGATISLSVGDSIRFRGTSGGRAMFSGNTISFDVYGNIESLEYGDNFIGATSVKSSTSFQDMFKNSTGLVDAGDLVLPATTLKDSCYMDMFYGCSNMVTPPSVLPALILNGQSYTYMFYGCRKLANAPEIKATTLASNSCKGMFENCSSLEEAPVLLPERIVQYAYQHLFDGCSSLRMIKCLATSWSNTSDFTGWVKGVYSTGTFIRAKGVGWPVSSISIGSGIPRGWTVIDAQ